MIKPVPPRNIIQVLGLTNDMHHLVSEHRERIKKEEEQSHQKLKRLRQELLSEEARNAEIRRKREGLPSLAVNKYLSGLGNQMAVSQLVNGLNAVVSGQQARDQSSGNNNPTPTPSLIQLKNSLQNQTLNLQNFNVNEINGSVPENSKLNLLAELSETLANGGTFQNLDKSNTQNKLEIKQEITQETHNTKPELKESQINLLTQQVISRELAKNDVTSTNLNHTTTTDMNDDDECLEKEKRQKMGTDSQGQAFVSKKDSGKETS